MKEFISNGYVGSKQDLERAICLFHSRQSRRRGKISTQSVRGANST